MVETMKIEDMRMLVTPYPTFAHTSVTADEVANAFIANPMLKSVDDTLKTAFVKMYQHNLDQLPVVDGKKKLLGNIDLVELLTILIEKKEKKMKKDFLTLHIHRPFSGTYV
jgi:CBS domain-containing protein